MVKTNKSCRFTISAQQFTTANALFSKNWCKKKKKKKKKLKKLLKKDLEHETILYNSTELSAD